MLDFQEISEHRAQELKKRGDTSVVVTVSTKGADKYYVHRSVLASDKIADVSPNMVRDIHDFHAKFGLTPAMPAGVVTMEMLLFRKKFLEEELKEFCDGIEAADAEQQLDALVDLVYVAIGTAYLCGWPFGAAWQRVHAANMTKVRAERPSDSKRGTAFDVVKPMGWTAPDLSDLVMSIPSIHPVDDATRPCQR